MDVLPLDLWSDIASYVPSVAQCDRALAERVRSNSRRRIACFEAEFEDTPQTVLVHAIASNDVFLWRAYWPTLEGKIKRREKVKVNRRELIHAASRYGNYAILRHLAHLRYGGLKHFLSDLTTEARAAHLFLQPSLLKELSTLDRTSMSSILQFSLLYDRADLRMVLYPHYLALVKRGMIINPIRMLASLLFAQLYMANALDMYEELIAAMPAIHWQADPMRVRAERLHLAWMGAAIDAIPDTPYYDAWNSLRPSFLWSVADMPIEIIRQWPVQYARDRDLYIAEQMKDEPLLTRIIAGAKLEGLPGKQTQLNFLPIEEAWLPPLTDFNQLV